MTVCLLQIFHRYYLNLHLNIFVLKSIHSNDHMATGESFTKTFKIPISYLDYDYIEKCTNVVELEKIFLTLK